MDNKYKAEMEFLMRLKDLLKEWLGVSKLEKDLKQQVEELSKRMTTLSTELNALSETVGKYKDSVDEFKTSMINQNLQISKNYETAVNRFKYLNGCIHSSFKKNDTIRNIFMELLSCRIGTRDFAKELNEETKNLYLNREDRDKFLNLIQEVIDFIEKQVKLISEEIEKEFNGEYSYKDFIIYPKANDKFDSKIHENLSIMEEDGIEEYGIIDQVLELGYKFPKGFSAKAQVTLKTSEKLLK